MRLMLVNVHNTSCVVDRYLCYRIPMELAYYMEAICISIIQTSIKDTCGAVNSMDSTCVSS